MWETKFIQSANPGYYLNFIEPLVNNYKSTEPIGLAGTFDRAQVIRIPHYTNVTVETIECS